MIHVTLGTSNLFAKFAGTTVLSMFENTKSKVTVHIMHDSSFTQENHDKFVQMAERYNQQVKFYDVERLIPDELDELKKLIPRMLKSRFTIITYFRLFLPLFIPKEVKKIIYIDSDIVVNLDINELYETDIGEKVFGACNIWSMLNNEKMKQWYFDSCAAAYPFVKDGSLNPQLFFNDGVMLIDLEKFREELPRIKQTMHSFYEKFQCNEQDMLNWHFKNDYFRLPSKFNHGVKLNRMQNTYEVDEKIIHYVESAKGNHLGLDLDMRDVYNQIFFKYFSKTPWASEKTVINLLDHVRTLYNDRQTFAIEVSSMMANKERAFFTEFVSVKHVKKTFLVKEDEEIIFTSENETWKEDLGKHEFNDDGEIISYEIHGTLKKLVQVMTESKGRKVFFMLVSGFYPTLCKILEDNGFVEKVDFINGDSFRCELSGEPLETYSWILNM